MKKNTLYNLLLALGYATVLILGMVYGFKYLDQQGYIADQEPAAVRPVSQVDDILDLIDKKYVDAVNTKKLKNIPLDSLLHKLDPHSAYLSADDTKGLAENLEGNFEGVGLEYYVLNDSMVVTGLVKDSPAAKAGVRLGDRILSIDSVKISGRKLPRSKFSGHFRGPSGSSVKVVLVRKNDLHKPLTLQINRGKVHVESVEAAYMINAETGYVRISKFGPNTDTEFINAATALRRRGMRKLILDLRDNGGGYFSAATGLADQFLAENKLIVYTEGKHEPRTDYLSTGTGSFPNVKLGILINENTASASEIVAGAIQDQGRGVVIGRRSFGKGLVQEQFPFEDGSALNLTIARYFTPSGRSIQKAYDKGYEAYQNEVDERFNSGELTSETDISIKAKDAKDTIGDAKKPQRAANNLGGIRPDIHVRLDTVGYTNFFNLLIEKKVMPDFVFEVLTNKYDKQSKEINPLEFQLTAADFDLFLNYLRKRKVRYSESQIRNSKSLIMSNLKALLCRYYFGDNGYYKAINKEDIMVKKALESL